MAELTKKQTKFAETLSKGSNQADAYRKAYDTKNMSTKVIWQEASILAANPKVAVMVKALQSKALKRREISVGYVLDGILANLEVCSQKIPMVGSDGKPVMVMDVHGNLVPGYELVDASQAGANHERLMKYKGLYEADNTQKNPVTESLAALSTAQKAALIGKLNAALDDDAIEGECDEED